MEAASAMLGQSHLNYFQQIDFDHVLRAGENWYHGDKDRRLSGGHWWSNRRKSQVA